MDFLKQLGIKSNNFGASVGGGSWLHSQTTGAIASINPATGAVIANVQTCSEQDYETLVQQAQAAFFEWRAVPAPKRGELIRQMGDMLRQKKDALGSLVSIEMGK